MSIRHLATFTLMSATLLLVGCNSGKIRPSALDCPSGCWTDDERCSPGTSNNECGGNGQWCVACGDNASCSAGTCVPHAVYLSDDAGQPQDAGTHLPDSGTVDFPDGGTDAGTVHPNGPLGTLALDSDFQISDWKPFDPLISKVAALQTEVASADPKLYGLLLAQKEIRSLGTWSTFGVGNKLSDATSAADLGGAQFTGVFIANRETVLVGYKRNGSFPKAFLFSETRALGERTVDLFGDYRAGPVGDFFSLSANGANNLSGNGVYLLLTGPAVNSVRKTATHAGGAPANITWAVKDLTIVGVPDAAGEKLYACSWKKMQDAYSYFKTFNVGSECLLIHQATGITQIAPLKSGLLVSTPSAAGELVQYVGLSVTGPFDTQVVSSTPAEPFLSGALPGTEIEFFTPYAQDILVAVKDSSGRRLVRITRN